MASVSLEEKRLKQLKEQLFGKEQPVFESKSKTSVNDLPHTNRSVTAASFIDPLNLKSDLTKIAILSTLALGIQFSLFLVNRAGVIRLFH